MNLQAIAVSGLSILALACGGQSGTEGTFTPPYNCVCDQSQSDVAIRGTVTKLQPLQIEVLEIFAELPMEILQVGDQIGGDWSTDLPCHDSGTIETPLGPLAGSEVLVLFSRSSLDQYPNCAEYKSCSETECGMPPGDDSDPSDPDVGAWDECDGDCVTSTRDVCLTHRGEALLASNLVVMEWSEAHRFGALEEMDIIISTADLTRISLDQESCHAAFPAAMTEAP